MLYSPVDDLRFPEQANENNKTSVDGDTQIGWQARARLAVGFTALVCAVAAIFMRGVMGQTPHAAVTSAVSLLDFGLLAKMPPYMSAIHEGSEMAVAVVLGQALKPDGNPSELLVDRAKKAKQLLDNGEVQKVIASGGDPAMVGHTEASTIIKVLTELGVSKDSIIPEIQATTTAENAWFALRWIPEGTGKLYIVTSEFHMPRSRWIFEATINHYYNLMEESYKRDPDWKTEEKRYPRLEIHEAIAESFCGNITKNNDSDPSADDSEHSLAKRAVDELRLMGSGELAGMMYGPPLNDRLFIWGVPINVTRDPRNKRNMEMALARSINMIGPLCACTSPPEREGDDIGYPLESGVSDQLPEGTTVDDWERIVESCPIG